MAGFIDKALGIHPEALRIGSRRLEVLAANLANADTPNYKARDIDFRDALKNATADRGVTLETTDRRHLQGAGSADADVLYRVPLQPSLDGNTVDAQTAQANFAQASVRYQASLDFLSQRIAGLREALKGQ